MAPKRLKIERILCPTDFSRFSACALDRAVRLAGWFGARLTVLRVIPEDPWSPTGPAGAPYVAAPVDLLRSPRSDEANALEQAIAPFRSEGVAIDAEVRVGDPAREIEAMAAVLPADLLVMGTHGRSGLEHLLLGSVTERVLRRVPCPVLTVGRSAAPAAKSGALFHRVLCAVDLTKASRGTTDLALSLAEENLASVTLLHVLEGLPGGLSRYRIFPNIRQLRDELAKAADEQLSEILPPGTPPAFCAVSELVREGVPWAEVLRLARETDADLIVTGAHARSPLGRLLFGSTADQVVRQATCPVLVVRETPSAPRPAEEPVAVGSWVGGPSRHLS